MALLTELSLDRVSLKTAKNVSSSAGYRLFVFAVGAGVGYEREAAVM